MYVIPGVRIEDFTVDLLSSVEYLKACQPGRCKVWEDVENMGRPNCFRLTKTLVRFVYDATIQLRASEVPRGVLPSLSRLIGGLEVDRALLMEKTTRAGDPPNAAMRKVKSLLLFHRLPSGDGFLWSNPTLIVVGSIPRAVAALVNTCGKMGSSEPAPASYHSRKCDDHIMCVAGAPPWRLLLLRAAARRTAADSFAGH
eukprot:gene45735-56718_t